jgi:glutamate racemase
MIGLIDWGIGGIGIYKQIRERLGGVPVNYFSDTGATPYGKMSGSELARRLDTIIGHLKTNGSTRILIACNAASTAIPNLSHHGIRIEGVIEPAVRLAVRSNPKKLGLVGGRRTVLSGIYRKAFADNGIIVMQRIAQPLSGLIESGDTGSEKLQAEAKRILEPLRNCSHILLACTHYPAIKSILANNVSAATALIDPAAEVVDSIAKEKMSYDGVSRFFTTGDPVAMKAAALNAFGLKIDKVERVTLP